MVICPRCGHKWEPRTGSARLHCSNCSASFARPAPVARLLNDIEPCDLCGHEGLEYHVCRIDGDAAIVCSACLQKLS